MDVIGLLSLLTFRFPHEILVLFSFGSVSPRTGINVCEWFLIALTLDPYAISNKFPFFRNGAQIPIVPPEWNSNCN